jgi:KUP system potassium uptake protein
MDLGVEIGEDNDTITNKGSMWALDQKLDQPMDEEAGRLRTMYREKVFSLSLCLSLSLSLSLSLCV